MREDPELDEALVERARDGDTDALDTLIRRHYEVAYRVALGVVRDADIAADVVQDAFVKATRSLHAFRGDAAFRSWMMTIVKNEGLGALRRSGRRRELALDAVAPPPARGPGPVEAAVLGAEAARARTLVGRLPEKQRLAVTLRIDEDLSFREVGEMIGSTEGAARVNYHHGITKLRSWMMEETK